MTNEEKKAIAYLKSYCTNDVLYDNTHYEQIKILLNLIETQQKEIEELKEKCRELIFEKQELTSALLDSTPNTKIKAKIEEYDKMINATYEDLTVYGDCRRDVCIEIKNILQSLLEEE